MVLAFIIITFLPLVEILSRVKGFILLFIISCIFGFTQVKKKIKFDLLEYIFLSFLIVSAVSTYYSWSFSLSLSELLRYISYFLIFTTLRRINISSKYIFFISLIFTYTLLNVILNPLIHENVRFEYWRQAWEGFRLSPIFGIGPDTFRYVSIRFAPDQRYFSTYPLNYFIQLLMETGIIGGSLFLLLMVVSFIKIINSGIYKKDIFHYVLFLGTIGFVVYNFVENNWQNISLFLYFWIILSVFLPIRITVKNRSIISKSIYISLFILFLVTTLSFTTGKLLLYLAKKDDMNITSLQIASFLIPWEAKQQQDLATIALSNSNLMNQYYLVRRYNDLALALDPLNSNYHLFRGNFENEINEYLTARNYFIKTILLNPPGKDEIYRELSTTYIKEAQKYYDEGNIFKSKSILLEQQKVFPYMISINIENDYHSKKAIGDVIAYVSRKTENYQFLPRNLTRSYNIIKKI